MKIYQTALIALIVILIVIQFFHPAKNASSTKPANHIAAVYNEPESVRTILDKACNDCHSNNTRYPWYNNIQPVAWWLDNHVQEGKRGLNFNEFATYSPRKQYDRMDGTIDLVKKGAMPLNSYTWIHKDAILS